MCSGNFSVQCLHMINADIGLIGLGTMGANLARNIASKGFSISVFNRTSEKTSAFLTAHDRDNLTGELDLKDFVLSIQAPRKIILLVKAGEATDATIESLLPHLEKGDTLIDGGNALYTDTIRREKFLSEKSLHFFGCGVSGGEEGALHGPSLMPGGSRETWEELKPIFEAIAAKDFSGRPCVSYLSENGAGHFVKMVHNGIEYAVMQIMAEAYELLSRGYGLEATEIADIFENYGQRKLKSFLFDIVIPILRYTEENEEALIDKILDKAGQKGTGRWTAVEGISRGTELSTIMQAVNARVVSSQKSRRVQLASLYPKTQNTPQVSLQELIPQLESALHSGMIMSYSQGFDLMKTAAEEQNWQLNFSEIARIWQGGCIIRSELLRTLQSAFATGDTQDLLAIPAIAEILNTELPAFRKTVSTATDLGIPVFCLGSSLASFEAMTNERTSANLIQGLRDFFGAHTYKRIDQDGVFHTQWSDS